MIQFTEHRQIQSTDFVLVHTQYLKYHKLMHKIKDTELEKKEEKKANITTSLLCCINFKPVNNNCTETLSRSSLILLKKQLAKQKQC